MKSLLSIAILFFSISINGQVIIDKNVQNEFDSLFKIQPKEVQDKSIAEGFEKGFALLVDGGTDTLNLNELKSESLDTSAKVVFIDTDTDETPQNLPKDTAKFNQWLACGGAMVKDTFIIGTYFGFFAGFGTITKIKNSHSYTEYFEHIDQSEIYRKKLTDKRERSISLKATKQKTVLSKLPTQKGDIIYGKIFIETEPYYVDDGYRFSKGYIYKKERMCFLFKCEIVEKK